MTIMVDKRVAMSGCANAASARSHSMAVLRLWNSISLNPKAPIKISRQPILFVVGDNYVDCSGSEMTVFPLRNHAHNNSQLYADFSLYAGCVMK